MNKLLITLLCACVALAAEVEHTVDIFAWPSSASKSQQLARISYTYPSLNATIASYTAPSTSNNEEVVRVGFYRSGNEWSGIATSASNFSPDLEKKLQLLVDASGEAYHVGFSAAPVVAEPQAKNSKKSSKKTAPPVKDEPVIEVLRVKPGPQPHLNKPVVVSADGQVEEKEPEKSFLQK